MRLARKLTLGSCEAAKVAVTSSLDGHRERWIGVKDAAAMGLT
ncbi:MAG: hypothetical protein JWO33_1890 [Caulobacteraceae bacterium]|nr:hypothetical protein [Caulobacteraceae bacterium]